MNLEQFKQQMNSEAQERCNQQEVTIRELHQKIKEQQNTIWVMQNRCFAQTEGLLCGFCLYQKDGSCKSFTSEGRKQEP